MNIDKYIHELLFQHDCVIIPGLGGFIANYQSAYFNPSLQIFYPPNKKVAFNADVKENDGLLAKHISKKNDCTYDEANELINEFVGSALETLKTDKIVEINKVGVLRFNKDNNIEFNPGNESNFLLSSFGMSPVQAPAIRRIATEKPFTTRTEPAIVLPDAKPRRRIKIKQPWRILEVVPVAALLFYIILFPGTVNQINSGLSQLVPDINVDFSEYFNKQSAETDYREDSKVDDTDYASSGVYIDDESNSNLILPEDVINIEIVEEENRDENTEGPADTKTSANHSSTISKTAAEKVAEEVTEPAAENKIEKVKAEPKKEEVKPVSIKPTPVVKGITASEKFHIIGGAFGVKSNAQNYLNELKTYGYKAQIIGVNKRGLHMVSVHSTNNRSEMQAELSKIKKILDDKVWVFAN